MENDTGALGGSLRFGLALTKAKEWYQVLFVPYAIIFIPYVVLGTVAAGIAFYSGVDPETLKFELIPLGLSVGVIAALWFATMRWNRNRVARGQSLNKRIRVLEETNGLHFRGSGYVDYCASQLVCTLDNRSQEMNLFIDWHGSLKDLTVEASEGCNIKIKKLRESSGLNVIVNFGRILPKNCKYPFSFILRFDNSSELIRPFLKKVTPPLPERYLTQFLKFDDNAPTRFVEAVYAAGYIEIPESENYKTVQGGYHDYTIVRPRQGKSYKIAVSE